MNNALDELQKRTAGLKGHELRAALTQFHGTQAEEFAQEWEIVSHIANTGTGFSGTPSRQLKILRDWCGT